MLCAVGLGANVSQAQTQAYSLVDAFPGKACRAAAISVIAPWPEKKAPELNLAPLVVVEVSMNRHTEQEWQFAASDLESARHWLAARPQQTSERRFTPRPTLNMQDTYYDSSDWMIFRAGYALRVRRARAADDAGDGETEITLKSLHRPNGALATRTEISESVGNANLQEVLARGDGIGGRIRELVGSRPLAALFRANTRRERAAPAGSRH